MADLTQHQYLTPTGEAVWPKIDKPDDRFNPDGEYSVRLRYDPQDPEVQAFISELTSYRDECFAIEAQESPSKKAYTPTPVFKDELDDNGEPTGFIEIKAKMKALVFSKKHNKEFTMAPTVYDAEGTVLNPPPAIGNGSLLQVRGKAIFYAMPTSRMYGLSLRMEDVKVIALKEYAGSTKAAW